MARNRQVDARAEEAARYRRAAEEGLNQLDWCVNYFHRIGKGSIARVIERNRSQIRRQMERTRD
jgi:hypothetical protein